MQSLVRYTRHDVSSTLAATDTTHSSSINKFVNNIVSDKKNLANAEYCLLKTGEKNYFTPRHVLILSKTTRLQYELSLHNITYDQMNHAKFTSKLRSLNINIPALEAKHLAQTNYVNTIANAFIKKGISVRIVTRDEYEKENLEGYDLIVTAGGDGTFLTAASKIINDIPIIGFNSDYHGSEGHLCVARKLNISPDYIISKFLEGNYNWMYRQRITVTIENIYNDKDYCSFNGKKVFHALNEVFIGEVNAARVSYYEVSINNEKAIKQKSSGLSICSGTGSTAWHYSINRLNGNKLESIIHVLESMGINFNEQRKNDNFIKEACDKYNSQLAFDPSYNQMAYSIREPIFNDTFLSMPQTGFTTKMKILSRCSDAQIVLDGNKTIPFNYGTEITLQMFPENALRTINMNFSD
uniref:NAD(+) kinase n=1 Tax=Parastrongyloides trichosuri TaxID=131310 RepID=A0A0N4ZCH0_PARTI